MICRILRKIGDSMENTSFEKTPFGIVSPVVPEADIAREESGTIQEESAEADYSYFQALEQKGIALNRAQTKAVRHGEGPFLALAGAGSGKTSVLVCRTGYLLAVRKIPAAQILLVTFTKKAAEEMKERIAALPGISAQAVRQLQIRTFHSFFLQLLRGQGYDQKMMTSERFKHIIIKKKLKEAGFDGKYQPETLLSLYSSYRMNNLSLAEMPAKTPMEIEQKGVFRRYEAWKKEEHQLDFDDILCHAYELLCESEPLLKKLQERFQYIMVDEFQDTNPLQYEMMKMLSATHKNLFVAGDDDQTIYSFNGAQSEIILEFDKEFPTAEIATLDINYRSTSPITGLGNEVIRHNTNRREKTLKSTVLSQTYPLYFRAETTDEEAKLAAADILHKVQNGSRSFADFAILHRTASVSRAMFEQLTLHQIPFLSFTTVDQMFYNQWPIKAVMDHLRLALNPYYNDALPEVLPTLFINREKGMLHIKRLEAVGEQAEPLEMLESLGGLRAFQVSKLQERERLLKQMKPMKPKQAIKKMREAFYDSYLEANEAQAETMHKEGVKETLDELETSAGRFDSVLAFVSFVDDMVEMYKGMQKKTQSAKTDAVSLMTIHRAKGLEFPVVYLIGASETILPHSSAVKAAGCGDFIKKSNESEEKAIEEERRLAYVAITRAKEELYIGSPAQYRGKAVEVSRFFLEAFPHATQKRSQPMEQLPEERKIVKAWLCTNEDCIVWVKIQTQEDDTLQEKTCPICKSKMEKGEKEVIIAQRRNNRR